MPQGGIEFPCTKSILGVEFGASQYCRSEQFVKSMNTEPAATSGSPLADQKVGAEIEKLAAETAQIKALTDAELAKRRLEARKLEVEIDEARKPVFQRGATWLTVFAVLGSVAAIIAQWHLVNLRKASAEFEARIAEERMKYLQAERLKMETDYNSIRDSLHQVMKEIAGVKASMLLSAPGANVQSLTARMTDLKTSLELLESRAALRLQKIDSDLGRREAAYNLLSPSVPWGAGAPAWRFDTNVGSRLGAPLTTSPLLTPR